MYENIINKTQEAAYETIGNKNFDNLTHLIGGLKI